MDHNVIYFSIPAYDVEKLRVFYEKVFGWKFKLVDKNNEVWSIETSKNSHIQAPTVDGLLMKKRPTQRPMNYIHVESIDLYLKLIKENSGSIYLNKTKIEGSGWVAVGADPEGNAFALWETSKQTKKGKK